MKDLVSLLGLSEPQLNVGRLSEAVECLVGPFVDLSEGPKADALILGAARLLLREAPEEFLTQPIVVPHDSSRN